MQSLRRALHKPTLPIQIVRSAPVSTLHEKLQQVVAGNLPFQDVDPAVSAAYAAAPIVQQQSAALLSAIAQAVDASQPVGVQAWERAGNSSIPTNAPGCGALLGLQHFDRAVQQRQVCIAAAILFHVGCHSRNDGTGHIMLSGSDRANTARNSTLSGGGYTGLGASSLVPWSGGCKHVSSAYAQPLYRHHQQQTQQLYHVPDCISLRCLRCLKPTSTRHMLCIV